MIAIITVLVFLAALALLISASYFLVEAPLAKQKLKARLAAVQQVGPPQPVDSEILRKAGFTSIPSLGRFLSELSIVGRLQLYLQQATIKTPATVFLLIAFGAALAGALVGLIIGVGLPGALVCSIAAGASPFLLAAYKRQQRFRKFERQFPDAIDLMARAVRAGNAFTTALSLIGEEMSDPVAEEFRITFRQQNLGLPLRDAFANLTVRIPLPDVRIFVTALYIQREAGGNLGEILDNLSKVIRERFKILREVQVITAEARLSMYVLTAMPFGAAAIMLLLNPGYMSTLIIDPMGHYLLGAGAVLQFLGYMIIRNIVKIKV